MAKCALPKEVLWDMQGAGVLPLEVHVSGNLDGTQVVEGTREMAAWCRAQAAQEPDAAKAALLRATAESIDRALKA